MTSEVVKFIIGSLFEAALHDNLVLISILRNELGPVLASNDEELGDNAD